VTATATRPSRLRELDGLRGIAILLVVVAHAWNGISPVNRRLFPQTTNVSGGGYLGVQLFFVLSGFLITSLLLAEHGRTGRVSLVRFYERRCRRLLPALFLCTGLFLVYVFVRGGAARDGAIGTVVKALTYTADFPGLIGLKTNDWFGHTWTLAIEEQFYIVWPLLLLLAIRWGRRAVLTIALVGIAIDLALQFGLASPDLLMMHWDALMAGCAVAATQLRVPRVAGWLAFALLAAGTVELPNKGPWITTASVAVCLVALLHARDAPWLRARVLVYFGSISYGLYLWHPLLLRFGHSAIPTIIVAVVIADLSFRFVERRFLVRRVGRYEYAGGFEGPAAESAR
jgi:peptidoglycan/LPS O-acetylase OafA/YrhL